MAAPPPGRRAGGAVLMLGGALALGALFMIAPPGGAAGTSVQLMAKEFLYEPKEITAPPGGLIFVVKNGGAIEHNFVIEDGTRKKLAEIAVIEPGETAEVKATLGPGAYIAVCTLPGHREAGMVARLNIAP